MERRIITTAEIREYLLKLFGVTEQTIYRALRFENNSDLSRKIRSVALEKGAEMVGAGDIDTTFKDEEMIQVYGGRLRIIYNKITGVTNVYLDGEIKETHVDQTIDEYQRMLERLITLCDTQR